MESTNTRIEEERAKNLERKLQGWVSLASTPEHDRKADEIGATEPDVACTPTPSEFCKNCAGVALPKVKRRT